MSLGCYGRSPECESRDGLPSRLIRRFHIDANNHVECVGTERRDYDAEAENEPHMSPGGLGMFIHNLAARYYSICNLSQDDSESHWKACEYCYYPQLEGLEGNGSPFWRSYELQAIKHLEILENWQCAPSWPHMTIGLGSISRAADNTQT